MRTNIEIIKTIIKRVEHHKKMLTQYEEKYNKNSREFYYNLINERDNLIMELFEILDRVTENKEEYYVLCYDTKTTTYHNEPIFRRLSDAIQEYFETTPLNEFDRVEILYFPPIEDGDSIVLTYKNYKNLK